MTPKHRSGLSVQETVAHIILRDPDTKAEILGRVNATAAYIAATFGIPLDVVTDFDLRGDWYDQAIADTFQRSES